MVWESSGRGHVVMYCSYLLYIPAVVWWPVAHTAAAEGYLGCSHSLPGRWHWPDPMVSSLSPPQALPETGMMMTRRKTMPSEPVLPMKLYLLLPFLLLLLLDRFPDWAPAPARRPPHLPPPPSPGGGRSPSGPRRCWRHPSPSLSPGAGAVGGVRGARAPCRPGQPIAMRGRAVGPPWGKGRASGNCRMGFCRWGQVGFRDFGVVGDVYGGGWERKGWERRWGEGWWLTVLHLMRRGDPGEKTERKNCVIFCCLTPSLTVKRVSVTSSLSHIRVCYLKRDGWFMWPLWGSYSPVNNVNKWHTLHLLIHVFIAPAETVCL